MSDCAGGPIPRYARDDGIGGARDDALPASAYVGRRTTDQRRANPHRPRHPLARLRPDPPADRGPNFDWDATAFDGKVTTTVVSLRPGLDSIVLDMGRRLAVRSVNGSVGEGRSATPLRFSRPGDTISIRLPKPAGFRDTVRFTIDYRGKITQGRGLYFFKAEPGGRTGRSRSTAAAGPTGIPTGFRPTGLRTTRPPGIWSPRSRPVTRWSPTGGW